MRKRFSAAAAVMIWRKLRGIAGLPNQDFDWTRNCLSRCVPQQRDGPAAEQLVGLGDLVDRRTPVEHRQKMSGADGAALRDDLPRHLVGRAGDELIIA